MNRWKLTDEVRDAYEPIVQAFINKVETNYYEVEGLTLDLTDTELNPYTLWKLLEEFGYNQFEFDNNGWQLDFWIRFTKAGYKPLVIEGTGVTFELKLTAQED